MTLLEKIKRLKWFDSISKLRDILEELYNSSSGGSGGGTLQSIYETSPELFLVDTDGGNSNFVFNGEDGTKSFASYLRNNITGNNTIISQSEEDIIVTQVREEGFVQLGLRDNKITLLNRNTINQGQTNVILNYPSNNNINTNLYFPQKNLSGDYTLATTDDILKIDLDNRVYANNAAAITGGLTAKDLYRTATGELRIVV